MKTVKELKRNVMERLMCSWGENIAVFFITVGGETVIFIVWTMIADLLRASGAMDMSLGRIDLTNGVMLAATAASVLLLWGLAVPFAYGVRWYRIQQIRGNSVHARSIFSCYSSWKRAGQIYRLEAYLFVKRLYFIAPLSALLAAGILVVDHIGEQSGGIAYSAAAVLIFLLAGSVVCAGLAINSKYAPVPYLFALEPGASPKELIKKSAELTKDKADYIPEAVFSAAGWLIPCILIFPAIFSIPYIQMVYTAAINEIIESGEDEGKRVEMLAEEYARY